MRNLRTEHEIIAQWKGDLSKPVVSICCIAYNHERCIEDALEGFLIQKTDFPFEILIHDDASSDRTAALIREYEAKYARLIRPIYQTVNQYSQGKHPNAEFNFPRARGEYVALCEGDDYWTRPDKLQKQVSFLRSRRNYVLVHTDFSWLYVKTGKRINQFNKANKKKIPVGSVFENLILENHIATASVLMRSAPLKEIVLSSTIYSRWPNFDRYIWSEMSKRGQFGYLPEDMAVYRANIQSASKSPDPARRLLFLLNSYDQRFYFVEKYGISRAAFRKLQNNFHRDLFRYGYYLSDVPLMKRTFKAVHAHNGFYRFIKMLMMFAGVILPLGKPFMLKFSKMRHIY